MDGAAKLVSHESTKLCMMFNKPPLPTVEECEGLVSSMESSCIALLSTYFKFSLSMGRCLHKDMYFCILNILEAVKDLCNEAKAQRCSGQLKSVGTVWEKCNILQKLPKDNKDAVLIIFRDQLNIVQDALEELQQNIENGNESDFDIEELTPINGYRLTQQLSWTEEDRRILAPSLGLIKTAKACTKKITKAIDHHGNCDTENSVNELDKMAELVKSVSIMVDDFVLSLYPPMAYVSVRQHAEDMKDHLLKLLNEARQSHFYVDDDETWITFLNRAVNHNYGKICDLTPT